MNHLNKTVEVRKSFGPFQVGDRGTCTADLPDMKSYAVYFDQHPLKWVAFDYGYKKHFRVIRRPEQSLVKFLIDKYLIGKVNK